MLTFNVRAVVLTKPHEIREWWAFLIVIAKCPIGICLVLGRPKRYDDLLTMILVAATVRMVTRKLSPSLGAVLRALCRAATGGHGAGRLMRGRWQVAVAGEEVSNENGNT